MPDTASLSAKATFANQTHDYLRDQIKFADQKAAFLFTASSAMLAVLYGKAFHEHWLAEPSDPSSISSFVAMISLLAASGFAASVVVPRRKGSPRGFIFWGAVASYKSSAEYVAAVSSLTEVDLVTEKLHHCHELARIAQRKYGVLDRGLWLGSIGAAAAAISLLLPS
jgi:hypothetical protein